MEDHIFLQPPKTNPLPLSFLTTSFVLLFTLPPALAGFQDPEQALLRLFGNPCDCKRGYSAGIPTPHLRTVDCGSSTSYLTYGRGKIRMTSIVSTNQNTIQGWQCVWKPRVVPSHGKPRPCPGGCSMATQMHSTCYSSVQQCTHSDGKIYLTAILERTYSGSTGGEFDYTRSQANSKYGQASCLGTVGQSVCWPQRAPIHITDGGGPSDQLRE